MPDVVNLVGRTFAGYAIEKKLGAGGMGVVYRAFDERLRRVVAVKILPPLLARDENTRLRFLREGRTAARIDHPNAVRLLAAGEAETLAYLVMEYVDGGTLQQRLDKYKKLPAAEVISIARQIAAALGAAHKAGILHRDVKPANVLFTKEGEAKLADFGLAREEKGEQNLSLTGMVMGTPHYMAPEVCEGKKAEPRSDLYALGVMMYLMASGKYPFDSDAVMQLLMAHVSEVAPPLEGVPASLADIVDRLMAKKASDRFSSADELIQALDRAAKDPEAALAAPRPAAAPGAAAPAPGTSSSVARSPGASAAVAATPSGAGVASPSRAGSTLPPLSMAAPLPVPRWHYAAYALAGAAMLLSAALLVWIFTRESEGGGGGAGAGGGGGGKAEQPVDPAELARAEQRNRWLAFQARARGSGIDIERSLEEARQFELLDPEGVKTLREELFRRLEDEILAKIAARGQKLVDLVSTDWRRAASEAQKRTEWPDWPFARSLAEAEARAERRVWEEIFSRTLRAAEALTDRDEFREALKLWEDLAPPEPLMVERLGSEVKTLLGRAMARAEAAAKDAPKGEEGGKKLRDLAKKMPGDAAHLLEGRAWVLERTSVAKNPLDTLIGLVMARDYEKVRTQLELLKTSGADTDPVELETAFRLIDAGQRTIDRAMAAFRAIEGRPVRIRRRDGSVAEGKLFEVADSNRELSLETASGLLPVPMDLMTSEELVARALGESPADSLVEDALDFALLGREFALCASLARKLIRRGRPFGDVRERMLSDLVPKEDVEDARRRQRDLKEAADRGAAAGSAARAFLQRYGSWPLQSRDRLLVERVFLESATAFDRSDLELLSTARVEDAPGGQLTLRYGPDDDLLEDVFPMGEFSVAVDGGLTVAPNKDHVLFILHQLRFRNVRVRLEARTASHLTIVTGFRGPFEGVPVTVVPAASPARAFAVLPDSLEEIEVNAQTEDWSVVEVAVTEAALTLTVNGSTRRCALAVPETGAIALLAGGPLTIRSLSITGKPEWMPHAFERELKDLRQTLDEGGEAEVPVGQWKKAPTKETEAAIEAEESEAFLKPRQWTWGADYVLRFSATLDGKGTKGAWPELFVDLRAGPRASRRLRLSGRSRNGYLVNQKWMTAGFCGDLEAGETREVAIVVKGDLALLLLDGEVCWLGHLGPATSGGAALGVRHGSLKISNLRIRALPK